MYLAGATIKRGNQFEAPESEGSCQPNSASNQTKPKQGWLEPKSLKIGCLDHNQWQQVSILAGKTSPDHEEPPHPKDAEMEDAKISKNEVEPPRVAINQLARMMKVRRRPQPTVKYSDPGVKEMIKRQSMTKKKPRDPGQSAESSNGLSLGGFGTKSSKIRTKGKAKQTYIRTMMTQGTIKPPAGGHDYRPK